MNKLVIIGNGFDLAHDLKTRYTDFLLWYLHYTVKIRILQPYTAYDDGLTSYAAAQGFISNRYLKPPESFPDFESYKRFIGNYSPYFNSGKHSFLETLLRNFAKHRWVDIEAIYYSELKRHCKTMEDEDSIASTLEQVKTLNKGLEALKDMLIKYLSDIDYKTIKKNDAINTHFAQEFDQEWKSSQHNQAMLLNFNYTTTIDLYAHQFEGRCAYNFIHGLLNDKSNPIIFGYGDEMDSYYEKIAEFNNNDFLKHFKSFEYSKTDNYQKILPFLESFEYEVLIMGHSCGLSDRVLLNGVFEHQNCRSIKIYYYQKPDGTNDYDEKVREISRHFSANNRNRMRNLIVPFSKSSPLS